MLWIRAVHRCAAGVGREIELSVRVEHAILQHDGHDLRDPREPGRELLGGIDDVVSARETGEDIQPRSAICVIMEPDGRGLLKVGIGIDGLVRGARTARVVVVSEARAEGVAEEPGIGSTVQHRRHFAAVQVRNDRDRSGVVLRARRAERRDPACLVAGVGPAVERVGPVQRLVGGVLVGQHVGGRGAAQLVDEGDLGRRAAAVHDHRTDIGVLHGARASRARHVAPHPRFRLLTRCERPSGQDVRPEFAHGQRKWLVAEQGVDAAARDAERRKRLDELRNGAALDRCLRALRRLRAGCHAECCRDSSERLHRIPREEVPCSSRHMQPKCHFVREAHRANDANRRPEPLPSRRHPPRTSRCPAVRQRRGRSVANRSAQETSRPRRSISLRSMRFRRRSAL